MGAARVKKLEVAIRGKEARQYSNTAKLIIGRATDADVSIPNDSISREHLKIAVSDDVIWLWDLGSANGSSLGAQKIPPNQPVAHCDFTQPIILGGGAVVLYIRPIENAPEEMRPERTLQSVAAPSPPQPALETSSKTSSIDTRLLQTRRLEDLIRARERELEELKQACDRTTTDLHEAQRRRDQLRTDLQSFEPQVSEQRALFDQVRTKLTQSQSELTQLEIRLEERKRELDLEIRKIRAQEETEQAERKLAGTKITLAVEETLVQQARAQKELEIAKLELERIQRESNIRTQETSQARANYEELRNLAEKTSEKLNALQLASQSESEHLESLQEETRLAETSLNKLKSEAFNIENERSALLEQARGDAQKIINDAQQQATELDTKVHDEAELLLRHAQANANELKRQAAQEADTLRTRTKEDAEAFVRQTQDDVRQARVTAEAHLQSLRTTEEEKVRALKEHMERELSQSHAIALNERQTRWEAEERAFDARKSSEVDSLANDIERLLGSKLTPFADAYGNGDFFRQCLGEVKDVVRAVLLPHNSGVSEERLAGILPVDRVAKNRAKRYWYKIGVWTGAALSLVSLHLIFPTALPTTVAWINVRLNPQKSGSDDYVKRVMEDRAARPKFAPVMDRTFKASYVDNVLYTEKFADLTQDPELQKKWILELNQFFIKELNLTEKVIVRFAPIEGSMLKELVRLRGLINPQFEKQGIDRMIEVETPAIAEIKTILVSEASFQKFWTFQRDFYLRQLGP